MQGRAVVASGLRCERDQRPSAAARRAGMRPLEAILIGRDAGRAHLGAERVEEGARSPPEPEQQRPHSALIRGLAGPQVYVVGREAADTLVERVGAEDGAADSRLRA